MNTEAKTLPAHWTTPWTLPTAQHIVLDLETLSLRIDAEIIAIGAVLMNGSDGQVAAAISLPCKGLASEPARPPHRSRYRGLVVQAIRGRHAALVKAGVSWADTGDAAPQAQDAQDAETLNLARVAVSESEGCSFPQDWMGAAIKVCKSVIAASAAKAE